MGWHAPKFVFAEVGFRTHISQKPYNNTADLVYCFWVLFLFWRGWGGLLWFKQNPYISMLLLGCFPGCLQALLPIWMIRVLAPLLLSERLNESLQRKFSDVQTLVLGISLLATAAKLSIISALLLTP